ncbi:MAG TPA: hypothetical protein VGD61_24520 [Pyrinomonadaceae bacterium]
MFVEISKSILDLITPGPQEKDRAQEQIQPVLDRRFDPCIELWRQLWQFGDTDDLEGESSADDIANLRKTVDEFMHQWGALISVECLVALSRFQQELRKLHNTEDESDKMVRLNHLKRLLFPGSVTVNGKQVEHMGLLLLLRDQLGSNLRAASSRLG